jgi:hypothetical protein
MCGGGGGGGCAGGGVWTGGGGGGGGGGLTGGGGGGGGGVEAGWGFRERLTCWTATTGSDTDREPEETGDEATWTTLTAGAACRFLARCFTA